MIHHLGPSADKWDLRWMRLARFIAGESKDPSTKVGAVGEGETHNLVAFGWNGFPHGIKDHPWRLEDRDTKYDLTVHAEVNLLQNAPFLVKTLYCTHLPCTRCAVQIIGYQMGAVRKVVADRPSEDYLSRWGDAVEKSLSLFAEAGVKVFLQEP